jgi:ABC-type sugar transport system substrate-binding protein
MDDWPFQTATPPDRLVPDRCAVVMCSGSREHFDRLRSGVVAALVTYDFQQATEAALLAAIQIASQPGTRVPGVDVAVEIVTARNVKEHARRWVLWERGEPTPGEGR